MNPDEVIKELKKHGVDIHRKTLLRWEKAELVPAAKRRALGQGRGWETDYPDETIPEALTAHILKDIQRLTNAEIAEARKAYYEGTRAPFSDAWGQCTEVLKKGYPYDEVHFYANEARQGFLNAEIWPDWVTCITCGNEITAKEAFWEHIPYCNEECYEHYQTNGRNQHLKQSGYRPRTVASGTKDNSSGGGK